MSTITPQSWASNLLQSLGEPDTSANETVIEEWEAREGGNWLNTAKFNPLNTTQDEPGATSINDIGVKAYTGWQDGLQATVATLRNGLYDPVLNALKRQDTSAAVVAIETSPWAGAGGYSPSSWPTSSAAAAYTKAHADSGGGSGWSLNPIHDIGKAAGDVGSAVKSGVGDVAGAAGTAAGNAAGSAFAAVWKDAKPFIITVAFAGLGLSLIALGGYQATKQKVGKAMQQLQVGAPGGSAGGGGGKAAPAGDAGAAAGGIPPEAAAAAL